MQVTYTPKRIMSIAKRIRKDEESGCWLWNGPTCRDGYGKLHWEKHVKVHRVMFVIFNGDPDGKCVCHSCDNPRCVNPDHLWLGTNRQNALDKVAKKRHRFGENHPCATLNNEQAKQVYDLYSRGLTASEVAEQFNVSEDTVYAIGNRSAYKCLNLPKIKKPKLRGEDCTYSKYTESQVIRALEHYANGNSMVSSERVSGVSQGQIRKILAGQQWTHLEKPVYRKRKFAGVKVEMV